MVFILKQGPDVIEAIDAQPSAFPLTLKPLGYFFSKCNSTFSIIHSEWNIVVWNHPSTMNILSTLWILMAWCFSTRASVATVLNTYPCVSRCLRVNYSEIRYNLSCLATNDPVDQFNIKTSSYQTEYGDSHYKDARVVRPSHLYNENPYTGKAAPSLYSGSPSLDYTSMIWRHYSKWPMKSCGTFESYHQTSNISRTLVGNEIVDHSDVVGASPVAAAPTTSSFST